MLMYHHVLGSVPGHWISQVEILQRRWSWTTWRYLSSLCDNCFLSEVELLFEVHNQDPNCLENKASTLAEWNINVVNHERGNFPSSHGTRNAGGASKQGHIIQKAAFTGLFGDQFRLLCNDTTTHTEPGIILHSSWTERREGHENRSTQSRMILRLWQDVWVQSPQQQWRLLGFYRDKQSRKSHIHVSGKVCPSNYDTFSLLHPRSSTIGELETAPHTWTHKPDIRKQKWLTNNSYITVFTAHYPI